MDEGGARSDSDVQPIHRSRILSLYLVVFAIGFAPLPIVLRSPELWLVAAGAAAVVAVVASRRCTSYAGQSATQAEINLSLAGASAAAAITALPGFLLFGAITGIASLLDRTLEGSWPVVVCGATSVTLVMLYVSVDSVDFLNALHPQRPGARTPFFRAASEEGETRTIYRLAGLCAIALVPLALQATGLLSFKAFYFTTLAALVLVVTLGVDYFAPRSEDTNKTAPDVALTAAKQIFEAAGFQFVPRPRLGDEACDSIIALLDFYAIRPDGAVAGCVRADEASDAEVSTRLLNETAGLESAVLVLKNRWQEPGESEAPLIPLLLILDADNSTTLNQRRSELRGETRIIFAPSSHRIARMVSNQDPALKEWAEQMFAPAVEARVA